MFKRNLELQPIAGIFSRCGFSAAKVLRGHDKVYFDFGERWLPLVKQNRPRFITDAYLETPILDGKQPNCIWHRLMLDGCLPPETKIEIYSRTADDKKKFKFADWQKEPDLYLRGNGSELPFAGNAVSKEKGKGTWEFLFQNAKNRFLQMRLVFTGNGQKTPRISALRVYYPRFSYSANYLPSIYREDHQSAFFLPFSGKF